MFQGNITWIPDKPEVKEQIILSIYFEGKSVSMVKDYIIVFCVFTFTNKWYLGKWLVYIL